MIRAATPADAAEIADLHVASRRDRMPYLPQLHTDDEVRRYFRSSVLPSSSVLVAVLDGAIIGFAAVADGSLEHLYIHPAHLRHGFGSALLAKAKAANPGGLRLYVFQRNDDARAFYRRHHFRPSGFYSGAQNEEHEPDLVMKWSVDPDGGSEFLREPADQRVP